MRMTTDKQYIGQRIIDACLRENVCELMSKGEIVAAIPPALNRHWPDAMPAAWLKVSHFSQRVIYVPVIASQYMQTWRAVSDTWLSHKLTNKNDTPLYQQGYQAWLTELAADLPPESNALFLDYIAEADCAVSHRALCRQAFNARKEALSVPLSTIKDWHKSMLFSDQVASYLDHPYYPTARAKVGFDSQAMTLFAPEFAAQFELYWLAISKELVTLTSLVPECWPSMTEVGLDE